jgi:integrase
MAVELRKKPDGTLYPDFYGRYYENGKSKVVNLGVKWDGTPPDSMCAQGDDIFEILRKKAEEKLERQAEESKRKGKADHLTERLIESKTGTKVKYTRLADLAAAWRGIGRDGGAPSEAYLKWCDSVFKRFSEATPCTFLYEVNPGHADAFLADMRKGHADKTVKEMATLLKVAFARILPTGCQNPFTKTIRRKKARAVSDGAAVARRPLTDSQLEHLLDVAKPDPLLYPLTVCASHTGMRIGDVCRLKWGSVDLRGGWVNVATSKTGVVIEAPILRRLRETLETALAEREHGKDYVWPEAARMYATNKAGVIYRGKALFARAFAPAQDAPELAENATEGAHPADTWGKAADAVTARFRGDKRDRILDTLRRVAAGASYGDVQKATGRRKAIVSQDLRDAETVAGVTLRRGNAEATGRDLKTLIGATRQVRARGAVAASLLGWHNLRGTFVTIALSAGIPFDTVAKITGHQTAKVVKDHYYNPTREHTRAAMERSLPSVLTGAKAAPAVRPSAALLAGDPEDPLVDIVAKLNALTPAQRAGVVKMLHK